MKFFKRKLEPQKDFTTLECEVDGTSYGYFVNWFKRTGGIVTEVRTDELPKLLTAYRVDGIIKELQEAAAKSIFDFRNSLSEKLEKLDELINTAELTTND